MTDALTAFGLTAADLGHFADVLAAASSNANTNVSMMGETFKYCAPVAGALGFSVEDTAEAIGLMGNAGIKASAFHHDQPDRRCEAVRCGNRGRDHCHHECRRIHEEPVCDPG